MHKLSPDEERQQRNFHTGKSPTPKVFGPLIYDILSRCIINMAIISSFKNLFVFPVQENNWALAPSGLLVNKRDQCPFGLPKPSKKALI